MIKIDSPLRNIPTNLDARQAFFIDGIRHSAEVCDLAYKRLTLGLAELACKHESNPLPPSFAEYFLDAWAFVDAADRFRCLWQQQPNAHQIHGSFSKESTGKRLGNIRLIRNVSAHLAQRAESAISMNSAALGVLSWITLFSESPPSGKTCFIRPGRANGTINYKFQLKISGVVVNQCAGVCLDAGGEKADLSIAYAVIVETITYAENKFSKEFSKPTCMEASPSEMFGSALLDFSHVAL